MTEKSFWSEFLVSQVLGKVNTISVEKTDGCQMFINQVGKCRIKDHDDDLFLNMITSLYLWLKNTGIHWSWNCISQVERNERRDSCKLVSIFVIGNKIELCAQKIPFLLRTETTWWSSQSQNSSRRQSTARSSSPRPLRASRERLRRPLPSLHFQRLDPDFDTCNVSTCPALPAPRFVGDCLEVCALRMTVWNCRR